MLRIYTNTYIDLLMRDIGVVQRTVFEQKAASTCKNIPLFQRLTSFLLQAGDRSSIETSVYFYTLTRLTSGEDFAVFCHRENFKTYIRLVFTVMLNIYANNMTVYRMHQTST